jgi:hypothetical protein
MTQLHFGPRYSPRLTLKCLQCGATYTTPAWIGKKFCSHDCSEAWRREQAAAYKQKAQRSSRKPFRTKE